MQNRYENFMQQCLSLAKKALVAGDPPVGALIVFEEKIIGRGIESGRSTGDVTNHAEILAVKDAVQNGYADKLHLSSIFTTHEPCVMCSYVIRHYRIPEIVYGVDVPVLGGVTSPFNILSTETIQKWAGKPTIVSGICLDECKQLNELFTQTIARS